MTIHIFAREYVCLSIVAATAAISVLLSSLESLSLWNHYRREGLFSWQVHKARHSQLLTSRLIPIYDMIFAYPAVLWLLGLRMLFCGLVLLNLGHRYALLIGCAGIASTSVLLTLRGPDGKNGADQMTKIIFTSLALALLSPHAWLWRCEIVFLSAQLCLAYFTSGFLRIQEQGWRSGSALLTVLRQHTYGNHFCWSAARAHPRLTRIASCSVLIFECIFPVALLFPIKILVIFLGFGVLFHVVNAAVIGLNTFLWAFIAVYPAFVWTSMSFHSWLGTK
jgi:hypothetical protein